MNWIYYTDIKDVSWTQIKHKVNIISEEEQEQIHRFRQEKDKCRKLVGKLLVLHVLHTWKLWSGHVLPEFSYNAYKKPYVEGIPAAFNVSHSGDLVVCSFTQGAENGVDVEKVQLVNVNEYKVVLTDDEYHALKIADPVRFFKLWTVKEAVMKADGRGFFLDVLSFAVPADLSGRFEVVADGRKWHVFSCCLSEEYALALASGDPSVPVIQEVTPMALLPDSET